MPLGLSNGIKGNCLVDFWRWSGMQAKACSLISCTWGVRKLCKNSKIGLRWYDNHGHLTNKSFAHAKQRKWLMQMELTLSCGFVLDLLHSHGLDLGACHHLSLLWTSLWGLNWDGYFSLDYQIGVSKFPSYESFDFMDS